MKTTQSNKEGHRSGTLIWPSTCEYIVYQLDGDNVNEKNIKCECEENEKKNKKNKKEAHSTHTFDLPIDDVKRWLFCFTYSLWVNAYSRLLHIQMHMVGRRYNAVHYDTILHTLLQWLKEHRSMFQLPITHNRHPIDQFNRCAHP